MNGRQSGAVRYLASLSLYYYSPGLLRRSVSSLACIDPHSFFLSLVFFCLLVSLSLSLSYLLSIPSPKLYSFFFSLPTSSGPAPSTSRLFRFNGLSCSFARDQVRRTGDRTSCTTCSSYRFSRCAFCAHRAHGSPGSSVIFPTAESLSAFGMTSRGWHVVTI